MDDEPVLLDTLGMMLESFGYTVKGVHDGRAAALPVTAPLLDLTIPGGIGGKEAIGQIRAIDEQIPVFVASGYTYDPVMAEPTSFGFTASICKPFVKNELCEVLNRFLPVSAITAEEFAVGSDSND